MPGQQNPPKSTNIRPDNSNNRMSKSKSDDNNKQAQYMDVDVNVEDILNTMDTPCGKKRPRSLNTPESSKRDRVISPVEGPPKPSKSWAEEVEDKEEIPAPGSSPNLKGFWTPDYNDDDVEELLKDDNNDAESNADSTMKGLETVTRDAAEALMASDKSQKSQTWAEKAGNVLPQTKRYCLQVLLDRQQDNGRMTEATFREIKKDFNPRTFKAIRNGDLHSLKLEFYYNSKTGLGTLHTENEQEFKWAQQQLQDITVGEIKLRVINPNEFAGHKMTFAIYRDADTFCLDNVAKDILMFNADVLDKSVRIRLVYTHQETDTMSGQLIKKLILDVNEAGKTQINKNGNKIAFGCSIFEVRFPGSAQRRKAEASTKTLNDILLDEVRYRNLTQQRLGKYKKYLRSFTRWGAYAPLPFVTTEQATKDCWDLSWTAEDFQSYRDKMRRPTSPRPTTDRRSDNRSHSPKPTKSAVSSSRKEVNLDSDSSGIRQSDKKDEPKSRGNELSGPEWRAKEMREKQEANNRKRDKASASSTSRSKPKDSKSKEKSKSTGQSGFIRQKSINDYTVDQRRK